jgi:hypothetical protein
MPKKKKKKEVGGEKGPQNEVKISFWMNLKFHPKIQPEHTHTYTFRSVFQLRGRLAATDG